MLSEPLLSRIMRRAITASPTHRLRARPHGVLRQDPAEDRVRAGGLYSGDDLGFDSDFDSLGSAGSAADDRAGVLVGESGMAFSEMNSEAACSVPCRVSPCVVAAFAAALWHFSVCQTHRLANTVCLRVQDAQMASIWWYADVVTFRLNIGACRVAGCDSDDAECR